MRQGYEVETDKKKNTCVFFLAFRCGTPQHKKRTLVCSFLAPRCGTPHRIFANAKRDSDSRKIALRVNLFTSTQRVQFGRSVVAHSAAAQSCGRGPRLKQTKKRTLACSFLAFRCGTPQHKKEHLRVLFCRHGVVHRIAFLQMRSGTRTPEK